MITNSISGLNQELEEKIAHITKLVQAEIEEEKRRKRQQGVLVEDHDSSMDVDDAKNLIPLTLQSLLNSRKWGGKQDADTSDSLQIKILKGTDICVDMYDLYFKNLPMIYICTCH